MLSNNKWRTATAALVLPLMVMQGCKVMEAPPAKTLAVPAVFSESATDTMNLGKLARTEFFKDEVLRSLIDTAIQSNPDLMIAIERINIAQAYYKIQKGSLYPTLSVGASAGVEKYGDYTLNGVGNYDTNLSPNISKDQRIPTPTPEFLIGLRSTWEIDIWGKLRNKKRAAYRRMLATEKGRQAVVTALTAQVATQYYTILALDNELEILQRNVLLQENATELVRVLTEGGRATTLAVQQFEAQLLNTKAAIQKVKRGLVSSQNALNVLLGRFPETISRGPNLMAQAMPATVQSGIPADWLHHRPDVAEAALQMEAAGFDMKSARAAFYPSLTINPFMGLNAFKGNLLFTAASMAYGVVGGLSAPLFQQNQIRGAYKMTIAEREQTFQVYRKTVLQGFSEVQSGLENLELMQQQFNLKQQEVAVLQQAVKTSGDLFLAGYASYLEVITAQRNVLDAELALTQTQQERFHTLIELYRALGGGWSGD